MNFGFNEPLFRLPRHKEGKVSHKEAQKSTKLDRACDILRPSYAGNPESLIITDASRVNFAACKPFRPRSSNKIRQQFEVQPSCTE